MASSINLTNYIESEEPIKSLSPEQEALLHMAINRKITEVESGLLSLSSKTGYGHVNLGQYRKQGNRDNSHQSRPLDLLEVYCEESSQITTHINKLGGRAMRFPGLMGTSILPMGSKNFGYGYTCMNHATYGWPQSAGCMENSPI